MSRQKKPEYGYRDVNTGDEFAQGPDGKLTMTYAADGQAPTGQRGRTFDTLTASGRDLESVEL